jgi:hypothetical protein
MAVAMTDSRRECLATGLAFRRVGFSRPSTLERTTGQSTATEAGSVSVALALRGALVLLCFA